MRANITEKPEDYPYISYKGCILGGKEDIISRDFIFSILSKEKGEARKKYKAFTEIAIRSGMEDLAKKVYGGMILDGKDFINETLKRLKSNYIQKEEISNRKALKSTKEIEDIIDSVCEHFRISKEDALKDKRYDIRKIAISLMKKYTGTKNKLIGENDGQCQLFSDSQNISEFQKENRKRHRTKKKD